MDCEANAQFEEEMQYCVNLVEDCLRAQFNQAGTGYARLVESMRYSLLSGGKRIRAVICMKFCEAAGGKPEDALFAACAIEMLHTYTLIHDDLPLMDDDDFRRGKPANHIEFDEFTAALAGDALQASAFEVLTNSQVSTEAIVEMVKILAQAGGPHGVCGGQYIDLSSEGWQLTIDELADLYEMKTSALIAAAAKMGVIAAYGSLSQVEVAENYAKSLGLAFQIRDDVLDCISTKEELGKPIGSDVENEKTTFVTLLGVDACEKMVKIETEKAIRAIDGNLSKPEFLKWLAKSLVSRIK